MVFPMVSIRNTIHWPELAFIFLRRLFNQEPILMVKTNIQKCQNAKSSLREILRFIALNFVIKRDLKIQMYFGLFEKARNEFT